MEAVLLYLDQPARPHALLSSCFDVASNVCGVGGVSFVFADRLPHVQQRDIRLATEAGEELLSWSGNVSQEPTNTEEKDAAAASKDGRSGGAAGKVTVTAGAVAAAAERERAIAFWKAVHPDFELHAWQGKPGRACHMGAASWQRAL